MYRLLDVRAANPADLTARARLREAALEVFATRGFEASVRDIAARAGVSAGLITHHFGSKDQLRAEVDEEVVRRYGALKSDGMAMSPAQSIGLLARQEEHAALFVYLLRSVRDGSAAGRAFLAHLIEEAERFSAEGVAQGVLKPSRDPRARARYLVTSQLGGLLLQLALEPGIDLAEIGPAVQRLTAAVTLPTLELYTEGVLADSRYLDEFLAPRSETPTP